MSKLSRFKKAPAVRLPSKLIASNQRNRFDNDSDDDDDFVKRPEKQGTLSLRSVQPFSAIDKITKTSKTDMASTSVSEYFSAEQPGSSSNSQNTSTEVHQVKPTSSKAKATTSKAKSSRHKIKEPSDKPKPIKKDLIKTTAIEKDSQSLTTQSSSTRSSSSSSGVVDESSKVFCPFCMKKLGDKLTGTTHVKACAKDLPIEQVYEAIQLQEKQMKEWESLGLVYPGFASTATSKKSKAGAATSGRGRGGGRNKKKPADSDLELSIALSVSLHEEVESRVTKENQFIIENGLENEIELAKVATDTKRSENNNLHNKAGQVKSKAQMPAPAPFPSRRRGKKLQVEELPLYSVNPERKREIIGDRVAKILDDCENSEVEKFYVRDEVPNHIIGVPKRLIPLQNKSGETFQDSTLWTLAEGRPEVPENSFSVLELKDLDPSCSFSSVTDDDRKQQNEPPPLSVSENSSVASESLADKALTPNNTVEANKIPGHSRVVKQRLQRSSKNADLGSRSSRSISRDTNALKNLTPIVQDIARMLLNRIECDIVLYGREEKPIKCHRFMLLSRCPKLLDEVIVEENSDKVTRSVIPLIGYSHEAVKAFLWYVYTGNNVESNEELLIEVEDIAKAYDVEIPKSTEETTTKTQPVDRCSVVVQTDSISTEDIYTMTEDFNSPETSPFKKSTFNPIIDDDMNINTTCEDLFKNYETGAASPPPASPIAAREADSADQNRCDDDSNDNKSVDLFEDIDWEGPGSKDEPFDERGSFNRTQLERPNKSGCCKEKLRQQQTFTDDEDYLRELATPFSSSSVRDSIISQKKRSRSVSPVLDNSGNLYTATQVAGILQTRRDGGDVLEYMNKAIKKQKLDFNDDNFNECNENSDSELGQISLREFIENRSFNDENNASDTLSNHSVVDVYGNSLQCETPKRKNDNDKSLRKTVSTPNLCTKSPNGISPFYNHQKQLDYDEFDALADACDDSMFAKIPEEAFSPKCNSSRLGSMRSVTANNILPSTTSQSSHTPSRSRRRFSPRNLISEDDTSVIENGQDKKKGQQKKKGKPTAPKVKLPSRIASNTNVSQPPLVDQSIANNGKSPMLNYSLIDTPILKEELRRYGIKPLPRSKAKVLLRHIYKETHK